MLSILTKHTHIKERKWCLWKVMDMLIGLIVAMISQCICISKYQVIYLKYLQFLFVKYTSVRVVTKFYDENGKPVSAHGLLSLFLAGPLGPQTPLSGQNITERLERGHLRIFSFMISSLFVFCDSFFWPSSLQATNTCALSRAQQS